jgi:hypothetical protein
VPHSILQVPPAGAGVQVERGKSVPEVVPCHQAFKRMTVYLSAVR